MHLDMQTLSVVTIFVTALLGALLIFADCRPGAFAPRCGGVVMRRWRYAS